MLDLETISGYYHERERIYKRNILREYLQYKILNSIFNDELGGKLIFIGGTAIRIVHQGNRFSEDLDFDNFGIKTEEFVSLSERIKRHLELEGYQLELKTVHKGAYRAYFRFLNLLSEAGISLLRQEKLMIQMDSEAQNFSYRPQYYLLNKFDVFTNILITPVDLLLSLKLCALLNRKRIKARDIYDITFLFGKTEPNYQFLAEKAGLSNKDGLKKRLRQRYRDLNSAEMKKEIAPFLINKSDARKIDLFKQYIASW